MAGTTTVPGQRGGGSGATAGRGGGWGATAGRGVGGGLGAIAGRGVRGVLDTIRWGESGSGGGSMAPVGRWIRIRAPQRLQVVRVTAFFSRLSGTR